MVIDAVAPATMRLATAARPLGVDLLLQFAILAPVILLVSAVLFLLIEKPFMNLSRAVSRRVQNGGAVPVPARAASERASRPERGAGARARARAGGSAGEAPGKE